MVRARASTLAGSSLAGSSALAVRAACLNKAVGSFVVQLARRVEVFEACGGERLPRTSIFLNETPEKHRHANQKRQAEPPAAPARGAARVVHFRRPLDGAISISLKDGTIAQR